MQIVNSMINFTSLSMATSSHIRSIGTVTTPHTLSHATQEGDSVQESEINSSLSVKTDATISQGMVEREQYREEEISYFSAQGSVQTKDNRALSLDYEMLLHRHFSIERLHQVQNVASLYDPLVVNTSQGNLGIDGEKFTFDLNHDGNNDTISMLSQGNAFLVYDKNSNHRADDGSELFGTSSGDGFHDLLSYDSDSNGWIDENDPIFKNLHLWYKNRNNDSFVSLQEGGIGALFLDKAAMNFTYKDSMNRTHAQLKSASIYLTEEGKSGVVGQIDLAIEDPKEREAGTNSLLSSDSSMLPIQRGTGTSSSSVEETIIESLKKQIKDLQGKVQNLEQQKTSQNEETITKEMQMLKVQIHGLEQRLFRAENPQGFSQRG